MHWRLANLLIGMVICIICIISFVFPQFTSFHSVFHSFHGLMNSINWPASSVWVFIAQLGEHCSTNAEATGSNPVEAPKIFFSGYFRNCLNCDSLRWSHTHFKRYFIRVRPRASTADQPLTKKPDDSGFKSGRKFN